MSGVIGRDLQARGGTFGFPLAPSGFNVGGHLIGMKYAMNSTEFEPADTSWHTIVDIGHAAQKVGNTIFCIGTMSLYINSSSKGQIRFAASAGTVVFEQPSLSDSNYSTDATAWMSTWYGMWKTVSTSSVNYYFQMAEEGGSDFRANVSHAARTTMILYELTGVQ